MESFKNMSLYIKRAESYQTKEFIIEMFASNNIGKVNDVTFIKKGGEFGKGYNGAIVTFENWSMNSFVTQLLNQMSSSIDGTTKFTYDYSKNRYWIINVYKKKFEEIEEFEEITTVDKNLPELERIKQLENLVKSMNAQIHYMKNIQEKTERNMMEYEQKDTQHWLFNLELKAQLQEKDMETQWAEDNLLEQLRKTQEENEQLRCDLSCLKIELVKKDKECTDLKQELYDNTNIINFVEEQANEMRDMIQNSYNTNTNKMTIEELID